jgi:predicted DNA-binding transcriptional regulator AlpA
MTDKILDPTKLLLRPEAAAMFLGCSPHSLAKWRMDGTGPRFVKIGSAVRYVMDDLHQYVAQRTRESTSAA